jgi:hypothetical protein
MKKWLRRCLIAAGLICLAYGILYEYATHVGRGWLNDEAFYQGRPTSYWRSAIDAWVDRFDSPDEAENYMRAHCWEGLISSTIIMYKTPRPTIWTRARGWVGLAAADNDPPEVLAGDADTEPVLRELEDEPALHRFIERARRQQRFRTGVRERHDVDLSK